MRKSDDGLRPLLHAHLRVLLGSPVDWQAIESALTGAGIPDSNACWRGKEIWVECKATPSRGGYSLPSLDTMQVGWHIRRMACGGTTWVLTRRRPRSNFLVDELWLHRGTDIPSLYKKGLKAAEPLLYFEGGVKNWDWDKLGKQLFNTGG